MPKIIVMNQGTEHTRGYDANHSEPLRKSVGRCTWFADQGDIIVSPIAIEPAFLSWVANTLGFDASSITVLVEDHLRATGLLVSAEDLRILKTSITRDGRWYVMPCFWTPDVAAFTSQLGLSDRVTLDFAAQRGIELFNRKRHFRQFAAGAAVPIPEGSVATSAEGLALAMASHLPRTGTIIIKKDDAAGGLGNITVTTGRIEALPGARVTLHASDARATAAALWEELTDAYAPVLVVEVYHAMAHSFYFEYYIGADGLPIFLHSGDVRFRPPDNPGMTNLVWVGLDTPTELPHFWLAKALTFAERLVMLAARIGCRGHINIDAIVTTEGELLFNESNMRWGGGTSMHTVGERLLGPGFANRYAISLVRDVKCLARTETIRALAKHGLEFSSGSKEGVLVLACDERSAGAMECLVIGANRPRLRELETAMRRVLA